MERLLKVGAFASERLDDLEGLYNRLVEERKVDEYEIPRHRRRRTKSHLAYKFPQKLWRKRTLEGGQDQQQVRKSRRKDKRGKWEGKQGKWLETHLWNSKRMHMGNVEGTQVKVAMKPADKGHKFMLRQALHGATVLDLSHCGFLRIQVNLDEFGDDDEKKTKKGEGFPLFCKDFLIKDPSDPSTIIAPMQVWYIPQEKAMYGCIDIRATSETVKTLEKLPWVDKVEDLSAKVGRLRVRGHSKVHACFVKAFHGCCCFGSTSSCSSPSPSFWQDFMVSGIGVSDPTSVPEGMGFGLNLDREKMASDALFNVETSRTSRNAPLDTLASIYENYFKKCDPARMTQFQSIIQASGNHKSSYFPVYFTRVGRNAWDILVPLDCGDALLRVWSRLVRSGAVACGVVNEKVAAIHTGERIFPDDYPNSKFFHSYWSHVSNQREHELLQKPLSKRPRFTHDLYPPFAALLGTTNETVFKEDKLVMVRLDLLHDQPNGAKNKLEVGAQILQPTAADIGDSRTKPTYKPIPLTESRPIIGYVTSCCRNFGTAFCSRDELSKRNHSSVVVLVRNRARDQNTNSQSYSIGRISFL